MVFSPEWRLRGCFAVAYVSGGLACAAILFGFYTCAFAVLFISTLILAMWRPRRLGPVLHEREVGVDEVRLLADQIMLRNVLDQTPAPLIAISGDGVFRALNRQARVQFETEEVIDCRKYALEVLLEGSFPCKKAITLAGPNGTREYVAISSEVTGPLESLRLVALLDIQGEIRAAEAAASRDLLQILSHEIMNALTPIASLASTAFEILGEEGAQGLGKAKLALSTIVRRGDGLTRFVEAYRQLARIPAPMLVATSVGGLVEEVAALFASQQRMEEVAFVYSFPQTDIHWRLDRDLIVHALLNLLSNGAQAACEGSVANPRLCLEVYVEGDSLCFKVMDNGLGISADQAPLIFQPFYTTKAAGTGVGLTFARHVALSHGGELVIGSPESEIFAGATFVLRI